MIFHAGRFGLPLPPMPTVAADLGRYEGRASVAWLFVTERLEQPLSILCREQSCLLYKMETRLLCNVCDDCFTLSSQS